MLACLLAGFGVVACWGSAASGWSTLQAMRCSEQQQCLWGQQCALLDHAPQSQPSATAAVEKKLLDCQI
jgi:hypothetical protein